VKFEDVVGARVVLFDDDDLDEGYSRGDVGISPAANEQVDFGVSSP